MPTIITDHIVKTRNASPGLHACGASTAAAMPCMSIPDISISGMSIPGMPSMDSIGCSPVAVMSPSESR